MNGLIETNEKLTLLVCSNIKSEVELAIKNSNLIDYIDLKTFSGSSCYKISDRENQSVKDLNKNSSSKLAVICSSTCWINEKVKKSGVEADFHPMSGCFDFFLNPRETQRYVKDGGYILTDGWLDNWQDRLEYMGFKDDSAKGFFRDFTKKLIYLNTTNKSDLKELVQFASYLNLPYEVVDADLSFLSATLEAIAFRHIAHFSDGNRKLVEKEKNMKIAEYELLFSMMKIVSQITDEKGVFDQIIETCKLLFDPGKVIIYSDLTKNDDINSFVNTPLVTENLPDKNGFRFKITNKREVLAVVELTELKHYKYSELYINTTLSISDVYGLAIANARTFSKLREAQDKFDVLIKQAESLGNIGIFRFDSVEANQFISSGLMNILEIDATYRPSFRDILRCIHPDDRQNAIQLAYKNVDSNAPMESELRVISKNGEIRVLNCKVNIMYNKKGKPYRATGLCRDITEYRQLQEQIRIKSHMESIGTLAKGYAHEINNPLTGILSYAQLILDETEDNDEIETYASEIIEEGSRIARITGSLIKNTEKAYELMQDCKLMQIIDEAIKSFGTEFSDNNITVDFQKKSCSHVFCYTGSLKNAFIEILANSIRELKEKYKDSSEGGRIEIIPNMVEENGNRKICISIFDNGNGINEDDKVHIFDPFFSTYSKSEAMGLGLTSAYDCISRIDGSIQVDSVFGEYCKFSIYLPVKENKQKMQISQ